MTCPESRLSIRRHCQLLSISRTSFYSGPRQEKADNLLMTQLMDAHILKEPTAEVLTMQWMLEKKGYSWVSTRPSTSFQIGQDF